MIWNIGTVIFFLLLLLFPNSPPIPILLSSSSFPSFPISVQHHLHTPSSFSPPSSYFYSCAHLVSCSGWQMSQDTRASRQSVSEGGCGCARLCWVSLVCWCRWIALCLTLPCLFLLGSRWICLHFIRNSILFALLLFIYLLMMRVWCLAN